MALGFVGVGTAFAGSEAKAIPLTAMTTATAATIARRTSTPSKSFSRHQDDRCEDSSLLAKATYSTTKGLVTFLVLASVTNLYQAADRLLMMQHAVGTSVKRLHWQSGCTLFNSPGRPGILVSREQVNTWRRRCPDQSADPDGMAPDAIAREVERNGPAFPSMVLACPYGCCLWIRDRDDQCSA